MSANFNFEAGNDYQSAGVRFNVNIESGNGNGRASFSVTVDDLSSGNRIDFSHKTCPAVHDFTRGFTRWLNGRGGVKGRAGDRRHHGSRAGRLLRRRVASGCLRGYRYDRPEVRQLQGLRH